MTTHSLTLFSYKDNDVRVIERGGEPWFVAKDVADVLGYSESAAMTRTLDDDEKGLQIVQTPGGNQEMTVISEAGLYSAILRSRVPGAREFKRWVTHEVLPAIRRHGGYLTPDTAKRVIQDPEFLIELATALKSEQEERRRLEAQARVDRPKVLFAESVATSHTTILIGELAKILRGNGVEIGQQRLFAWMRENGFLIKAGSARNMPTQYAMERGLFKVKETVINHSDGHTSISKTPKVTGKGQQYFINLFLTSKETA